VADPEDLPDLLAIAKAQARECFTELAELRLRQPVLPHAVELDVTWHDAATIMVDDFRMRALQTLVDWLDAICQLMEERTRRAAETARQSA